MKKYAQLSITEREQIQAGLWEKKSIRSIAAGLGRSPSSISRELRRNYPDQVRKHTPRLAHERASKTILERGVRARLKDPRIVRHVVQKLKADYSPEQISGTLPTEHLGSKEKVSGTFC